MEDSPIGLDKWILALWQIVNCKNGVSSYEVHRAIGITQKSAWFLDRRIRFALTTHQTVWRIFGLYWKRGLKGTYISVEPFHLFRYLDEQAFRYNNRKGVDDGDRFDLAVCQIVGKRLTFDQLDRKDGGGSSVSTIRTEDLHVSDEAPKHRGIGMFSFAILSSTARNGRPRLSNLILLELLWR